MAYFIALISILILGSIVVGLFLVKPKNSWVKFFLILYIYNFLSELAMFMMGINGMKNHNVANAHVLLYGLGMFILIIPIWNALLSKPFSRVLQVSIPILYVGIWIIDSTFLHSFETFNPFSQSVIFMINLCLVIYLLNVLLFTKNVSADVRAYRFLIFAFLVHCFGAIIVDSFFNYYIELPERLYLLISTLGVILGFATNFLVLLSVLCLIRNKKLFSR